MRQEKGYGHKIVAEFPKKSCMDAVRL